MESRKHGKGRCDCCENGLTTDEVKAKAAGWMVKTGWYAHIVERGDDSSPTGFNYHTHGIPVTFPGAMDIQIVLPMPGDRCHGVAWSYIEYLRGLPAGSKFPEAGQDVDGIIRGYKVRMAGATEGGRKVLRLILPDKNGKYDGDFAEQQLKGCDHGQK
jgi:hypothetical protein